MPVTDYVWDSDTVELLTKAYNRGLSATEIIRTLPLQNGVRPTRNAVMGKLHRLGFKRGGSGLRPKKEPKPPKVRKTPSVKDKAKDTVAILNGTYYQPPKSLLEFNAAIPRAQRKTLTQLGINQCHWPIGDPGKPEFYFCGGKTEGGSYCVHHSRYARAAN